MEIGVVFPQTEIGADPVVVRAYAAAVEELGYRHILAYDHVLGADRSVHKGFSGPYDSDSTFHEPFVLFGFLAAVTELELVTGIIILPQRQTALVAKQAAEVDILSQGRLRVGVGLGWNRVEYDGLGKSFADRGRRMGEQIELLRLLWTQPSVTFQGHYETVTGAGLAPLPVQRPIPVWVGAQSRAAYLRAGALGDGWFPQMQPGGALDDALEAVRAGAREAGRDPATLGMHGRTRLSAGVDAAAEAVTLWRAAGATHLSIDTMGLVPGTTAGIDRHLAALAELAGAVALPRGPLP
ncbi:MAG TPA: LLM class F420-dependent oxidoreductase [Micromonosporaceae bacterium]|nr:LLM class F420-dependent oxidoreductase [Micromonosporaceae bacterium]